MKARTVRTPRARARSLLTTARAHATLAPFIWTTWVLSILYEVVIGRHMAPVTYGSFETVVAALAFPAVLAGVAQLAVAREAATASLPASAWTIRILAGAGVAGLGVWLVGTLLQGPLHLRLPAHTWPLVAAITTVWVALSAARGLAQGRERYVPLGSSYVLENGVRLAVTWVLVPWIGYWGGLLAILAGAALALGSLEAWVPWRTRLGRPNPPGDLGIYLAGQSLGAALPALPLLLLRPHLPSLELAALAAMLLLLRAQSQVAAWLSTALYPRLIALPADSEATFAFTALLALLLGIAIAAIGSLFLHPLLDLAFRGRYLAFAPLFRISLFAGMPLALVGLWLTRALAARDLSRILLIGSAVPLLIAGLEVAAPHGLSWVVWVNLLPAFPLAVDAVWARPHDAGRPRLREAG